MSSDQRPPGDNPYRGPSGPRPDKRTRERARAAEAQTRAAARPTVPEPVERSAPREQRVYGLNACLALFAARPQDLRKLWLLESRLLQLKPVIAWCVKRRIGYSLVGDEDLQKLSGSSHHEGVVMAALPRAELSLSAWLRDLPPGPQLAVWLDGVGNPHNLGAVLRSAAHFSVAGVLLPKGGELAQSGAALRVAEGGGEAVPLVRLGRSDNALAQLVSAGFALAATVVRGGDSLYAQPLPSRLVLVMGAEQSGVSDELARYALLRLGIPGSGAVESLNVAAATAVFLGEWRRQHPG